MGKLITWVSVHSELRIVQEQDWRLFTTRTPGTIDDLPYAFVHSVKAIALYRNMRAEELKANRELANASTRFDSSAATHGPLAATAAAAN